jgi:hypothetical protein
MSNIETDSTLAGFVDSLHDALDLGRSCYHAHTHSIVDGVT